MNSDAFKFACPTCGQHISAVCQDAGTSGTCPACNSNVIVPSRSPQPEDAASDITFDCPYCQNEIVVEARGAGTQLPCPHCSKPVLIPTSSPSQRASSTPAKTSTREAASSIPVKVRSRMILVFGATVLVLGSLGWWVGVHFHKNAAQTTVDHQETVGSQQDEQWLNEARDVAKFMTHLGRDEIDSMAKALAVKDDAKRAALLTVGEGEKEEAEKLKGTLDMVGGKMLTLKRVAPSRYQEAALKLETLYHNLRALNDPIWEPKPNEDHFWEEFAHSSAEFTASLKQLQETAPQLFPSD